ncbi:MAG: hypothetical protein M0Q53_07300 [Prolixibacteraceae bacterium]|jgi:tetratricopeptide (TPR) repeat protein|nr:hypothetical protein [Prolixibacteraceae bacterium]
MSVTKDQLLLYVEKPGLLKEQTIGDLKEIVEEFPYFQSAQLLYTYNLHSQSNFRFDSYLKICSIYATDRTILYRLLQPKNAREQISRPSQPTDIPAQDNTPLFELSEERQITVAEFPDFGPKDPSGPKVIDFDLLSFDPQDALFQLDESDQNQRSATLFQTHTKAEIAGEGLDLIGKFIKVNPSIQPRNEISTAQDDRIELHDDSENENDEFITETLSRIYLKQGHLQKAIDSFRRLSLKYPEKSVYFAEQIEEIKKMLK